MNQLFLDRLSRGRQNYFDAQGPKPKGGGKPRKLPKDVAQDLLASALEELDSVQAELASLDEHPARLRLLEKIKDIGKVRDPDKLAEAERRSEPNKEERKIMDRIIKLVRDELFLKDDVKSLRRSC